MKKVFFLLIIFLLIVSVGVNFFLLKSQHTRVMQQRQSVQRILFPFLSPRIFAMNQNDILIHFVDLNAKLHAYTDTIKDPFGAYFEYLPSGVSIGINSNTEFVLASLLKVPLAMAIYKKIEEGKLTLDTPLTIQKQDLDKNFGDLWKRGEGRVLTVKEAIYLMITDSDNTAKNMLADHLTDNDMTDVFNNLDIPVDIQKGNAVVSPKNYSSILRSLYLSSYLTKTDSNAILDIMSQTHFNDKIAQPIPNDIPVAHKIGVHDDATSTDTPIYTDCGIIYIPLRPYILCVMANSKDKDATSYMQNVSKIVYDYVWTANR